MKVNLNWGTSILIAFGIFISFILYFVIKVQSNSKYDNELVVEDYYKFDAHYQDDLDRLQRAHDLEKKPTFKKSSKGIVIVFPSVYDFKKIKGKVSLYRSSNKKFDFDIPISLSDSVLLIPKERLLDGLWDINMDWNYDGKTYLSKETIYF
jgi:hypothetical protein